MIRYKIIILLLILSGCSKVNNSSISIEQKNLYLLEYLYEINFEEVSNISVYNKIDENNIISFYMDSSIISNFLNKINIEFEIYSNDDFSEKQFSQITYRLIIDECACKIINYVDNYLYFSLYKINDEYKEEQYVYKSCDKIILNEEYYCE